MSITPAQCRSARSTLDMDQAALASAAQVSRGVIIDFEKGRRMPGANNLAAIRRVLEEAGVVFIDDAAASPTGGPGVRLKTPLG